MVQFAMTRAFAVLCIPVTYHDIRIIKTCFINCVCLSFESRKALQRKENYNFKLLRLQTAKIQISPHVCLVLSCHFVLITIFFNFFFFFFFFF